MDAGEEGREALGLVALLGAAVAVGHVAELPEPAHTLLRGELVRPRVPRDVERRHDLPPEDLVDQDLIDPGFSIVRVPSKCSDAQLRTRWP